MIRRIYIAILTLITLSFILSCGGSDDSDKGNVAPPPPTIEKFKVTLLDINNDTYTATVSSEIILSGSSSQPAILTVEDNGLKIYQEEITSQTYTKELLLNLLYQRNILKITLTYGDEEKEELLFADIKEPIEPDYTRNVTMFMEMYSALNYGDSIIALVKDIKITYTSDTTNSPDFTIDKLEYSIDSGKTWLLISLDQLDYSTPTTGVFQYSLSEIEIPRVDTGRNPIVIRASGEINGQPFTKYVWDEIYAEARIFNFPNSMHPYSFYIYPEIYECYFTIETAYIGNPDNHSVEIWISDPIGYSYARIDKVTYNSISASFNARPLACDPGTNTYCRVEYDINVYLDGLRILHYLSAGYIYFYK